MNLFHQLIVRQQKAAAEKQLVMAGNKKPKYEYDSDEDTEGGTWEHSKRNSEMESTRGTLCIVFAHLQFPSTGSSPGFQKCQI